MKSFRGFVIWRFYTSHEKPCCFIMNMKPTCHHSQRGLRGSDLLVRHQELWREIQKCLFLPTRSMTNWHIRAGTSERNEVVLHVVDQEAFSQADHFSPRRSLRSFLGILIRACRPFAPERSSIIGYHIRKFELDKSNVIWLYFVDKSHHCCRIFTRFL